ncbi:TMEM165/GDT1 family protein [Actinomycetospora endophytica]|uniref:GDT1 family protein n=1 Tax=Actinomycetospora endophytica TaxID=2291215 RepID=A0ABS8P955_9PSEU|nr:TMEM165/GDT1 family protein [Actinomycetospora endophytica]MCD2194798.1 TMEM165/GDT1 family protein [Actinomycetospora endophytica]
MVVVVAITFGIVFLAELADTSAIATLVLATKFPARWVLIGVFAGMAVHVVVAVIAGRLVALLPERPLEAVLAVIFIVGAFLLWREANEDDDDDESEARTSSGTRWGVITTAFLVTALSEFADPSELVIATLAARYDSPVAVGISALLALWVVSVLAVYGGTRIQRWVPVRWVTIAAAAIMVVLGVISAIEAIRG